MISALALIIFGPKRLPELGRTLGKTLKGLQTASTEFEKEIQKAMAETESIEKLSDEGTGSKDPVPKGSAHDQPTKNSSS